MDLRILDALLLPQAGVKICDNVKIKSQNPDCVTLVIQHALWRGML